MAFQSFVMCLPKKWRKWRKSKPISLWNLRNPSFRYTIRHYLRLLKRWWHLRTYDIMRYFKGRRPQFFYRAEIGYFKEYYTIMCVLWFDPFLIVCYFFTVWCSASINIWRGGKFISSSKMKIRFESWFLFCVCVQRSTKTSQILESAKFKLHSILWYYFEDVCSTYNVDKRLPMRIIFILGD